MASVRVAVRIRPLNKREKQLSSKKVALLTGNTISIQKPVGVRKDSLKDNGKTFSYDFLYDSSDRKSTSASQEKIFHDLGYDVLKAAFEGFNACVFAYGQTGSGKSYTMMGHTGDKGLIPRICEGLFCEMSERSKNDAVSFRTEVSFLEIYNERVRDLLKNRADPTESGSLRVREHPRDGPYVENLSTHVVLAHDNMEEMIVLGNASRTTASTGMNDFSSRSHAIFTIRFTQAWFDAETPLEMLSKIHLVDLAGSERADATRATGTRLKEGANINKSLVTLGSVISALADLGVGEQTTKKKMVFIPYRDSVLTWLLKDSLGGNSKTTMIATISPADVNYGETLSTLRYASRAKNIVNSPTVNEDGSVKVIRELQAEVTRLKRLLEDAKKVSYREPSASEKVEEELYWNEAKVQSLTEEWTGKWEENTENLLVFHQGEKVAMKSEGSGVVLDCQLPHLIGIDEDLLCTGITLYYLKEGRTLTGTNKASCSQGIVLSGSGLHSEHCVFENHAGVVTLTPRDGALCSVNGSVVTRPCQLTQGAIIRLGSGTMFRFNHPSEAAHLREKRQRGMLSDFSLSLTDGSKSAENPSEMMLQNPGKMEEKLKPQGMEWQQVRDSRDIKRLQKENTGPPHQQGAEEKTKGAVTEETGSGQMDLPPSKLPNSSPTFATALKFKTAIPGRYPASHTNSKLDADALQGGVSTRDGPEQETDPCHKSGPELMSEQPQRRGENGARASTYKAEEVWSGDGSLQQTSVLGPGDGCGTKPEGNANEIQGVVARCYKGRPGTGGSSLGCVSHLQSTGGTSSVSVLPQTSAHSQLEEKPPNSQAGCRPPGETTLEGELDCGEMDESGGLVEERVAGAARAAVQSSGLGSLISRVTLIVQDARRLLWNSPKVLQQVCEERQKPFLAHWSGYAISFARESKVLSVMKDSQALSMVKGSYIVSRFMDSHIFSMVKEMPLIQHIQMEITQRCQTEDTAEIVQGHDSPHATTIPFQSQPRSTKAEEEPSDQPLIYEVKNQTLENSVHNKEDAQIFTLPLIELPHSLVKLQKLPFRNLLAALKSVLPSSVFTAQKVVALFWLNVAKCSHPEPCPALLVLVETGLYTLTTDSDILVMFHHLPLLQLKEVQIGFAGHGLRLMGSTEESVLGVYTHSQRLTRELCWAILGIICPGDSRVSQHPLLQEDWRTAEDGMSLDWQAHVPDLLLDAGLRVCCQFQKSLADLVYLAHCNMEEEAVTLGEVRVLLYTSVAVSMTSGSRSSPLAQLLLTDTHLGLVREDIVFHPPLQSVSIQPCRPQFHNLTLRRRSDVRCVLIHDEDERGVLGVDVILANRRAGGHPESVTKASSAPAHASNSSRHAELWKLTFSCSTEAACLINHLSNV